ncbi:MAG: hypothetical protein IJP92_04190 [Lachnospiraceae bacterium]|nr:hypothetical protein [Lachnospiraceae bacterium]
MRMTYIPHPIWGNTKNAKFLILGTDSTAPMMGWKEVMMKWEKSDDKQV